MVGYYKTDWFSENYKTNNLFENLLIIMRVTLLTILSTGFSKSVQQPFYAWNANKNMPVILLQNITPLVRKNHCHEIFSCPFVHFRAFRCLKFICWWHSSLGTGHEASGNLLPSRNWFVCRYCTVRRYCRRSWHFWFARWFHRFQLGIRLRHCRKNRHCPGCFVQSLIKIEYKYLFA